MEWRVRSCLLHEILVLFSVTTMGKMEGERVKEGEKVVLCLTLEVVNSGVVSP